MNDINNTITKEYSTDNLDLLKLDIKCKYHLKLGIYYNDKNSVNDRDFLRTEELSIRNIDDHKSIEFNNCKFNDLKSLYFFETEAKENNDANRRFSITFKNCELNKKLLIKNNTKKLIIIKFENDDDDVPVISIQSIKDSKEENNIKFEFINFSIINSHIHAKEIKIVNNGKFFNFKDCTFESDVSLTLQKCSINEFENCDFKGLNTKLFIENIQRTEPNFFKKCNFLGTNLIINGNQTNPLPLEIEDGKFNVNKIDIKQININFKNVEFKSTEFYIEKNEDIRHQYGSTNIPSNLSFFGGAYKKFTLTDFGSNSFKFENCNNNFENYKNNIVILNFENGAKALELFNCIIEKFTINGEITDKAIFNNVTFINPPEIGDIKFKNCNVEFRNIDFKDKNSPQAIAGFRALNKACRDANYHHGEIFFHGLTLEGIGKNLKYKSDFVEKLFSKAYKIFSNFGRSLNRPFYRLIILGLVVFGINWIGINKVNDLKLSQLSQQLTINKFIIDNKQNLTNKDYFNYILSIIIKFHEEENQSNIINAKLVFKNAIGPLRIVLPRDFIEDNEEKLFKEKINFTIYFLNIFHGFLSLGIWSIWLFMIRARFKL